MKRKVLRVGRSSLAVSLPKPFVNINSLESGQEIDVTHHGASLTVKCEKPTMMAQEVDISDLRLKDNDRKVLDKILGALFRKGLDKFTITCNDGHNTETIRQILRDGKVQLYEEPGGGDSNKITVHSSISHFDETALENLLVVTIKEIYRNFDEFIDALESGNLTKEKGESLGARDKIINDHTDICKRIINKDVTDYESTIIYGFADRLEKIGDEVKYLIEYTSRNPENGKEHLALIKELKDFFFMLLSAKTSFSVKKITQFYDEYYDIRELLEGCDDTHVYHHCRNIVSLIADAYSNLMVGYL